MRKALAALFLALSLVPAFAQPPPVPALPDTPRITSYALTASTCVCSVGFAIYGDSTDYANWLEVTITTGSGATAVTTKLTAVTDYVLTSATGALATIPRPITNGVVTLTTARTGTLQIVGARRPRRLTQFTESRGVAARDLNQAFTDVLATMRETWDRTNDVTGRALLTNPGETIGPLPSVAKRAGGVLAFDSSGNPTAITALTGLGNVIGPNTATVGHIATFGNTAGTILLDGGLIGAGDMQGPASSTVNHAVTFADSGGKITKDSGLTVTPSTGTLTITNAKTLAASNSLTLAGTDGTTQTFQATDTIVGRATTDTLTNKTLTAPVIATIVNSGTLTLPTSTDTLAGRATTDTLTNKSIGGSTNTFTPADNKFTLQDDGDATKQAAFQLSGITTGNTRTLTVPDASTTIVGTDTTQTLTNKTLTAPTLTTPSLGVATATSINKVAITAPATGATLTIADGKTLTASNTLTLTGTDGTSFATPSTSDTLTGNAATQTLTNKTLTAPTINGGTHTGVTSFGLRSSGSGAFDVTLNNTENLSAARTLTVTVNNASRTVDLSGDLTTSAAFATAGGSAITLTGTGATNVTLPTSGTLATRDTAQTFSSANIFSALQQFTDAKFSSGKLYPTSDSTTAMQVTKADGTTRIVDFDTTNARVGINKTPGAFDLDVNGAANVGGVLSFGTLAAPSLAASTSTITGLTVNNSPNASNDYFLYYSAADGAIRKCTVGSCAAAATAGVSSLNGLTGGLSIAQGAGISVTAGGSSVTVNSTFNPAPVNLASRGGSFDVWQRGTPVSQAASLTAYANDGWYLISNANQASTITQATGIATGSTYAAKVQRNSGQTGTGVMRYAMPLDTDELVPMQGNYIAFSFTIKEGANQSFSHSVSYNIYCGTGSVAKRGASGYTGETNPISGTATTTTSAARVTATSGSTVGATCTQAEIQFSITPSGTAGVDDSFTVDDLQLEVVQAATNVASPYIYRKYGEYLSQAQRFLVVAVNAGLGLTQGSAYLYDGRVKLPVTMRSTPTLSLGSFTAGAGSNGTFASPANYTGGANSADMLTFYNSASNWSTATGMTTSFTASSEI